jgi:zinc transport system substrate-binding protein
MLCDNITNPFPDFLSMKKRLLQLILIALPGLAAFPGLAGAEKLSVFVSILPQKYFVEQVGGDRVQVAVMVGPGQSPATYAPGPKQMAALSRARLYYRIGVPFEDVRMERILAANPGMSLLDARDGIQLRQMEPAGGHNHGETELSHREGRPDPHIWLNPSLVKVMAAHLRDRLVALDPGHGAEYQANFEAFAARLDRLDRSIQQRLSHLKRRTFMVFHPSWGYFSDRYHLRQIPVESEGKEPGARTLARVIDQAREQGVQVIFVQRQFSQSQAKTLARAVGAGVEVIDSLAEDYPANLRRVANLIAEADQ